MELKDFVSETLVQIIEGVTQAQSTSGGDNVNAAFYHKEVGKVINSGTAGRFTEVEFDVSILTETTGKGGAKLTVMGFGVGGEGERKAGSTNRISFSVPLRLPDGDEERVVQARKKANESRQRALSERAESTARRSSRSWMG